MSRAERVAIFDEAFLEDLRHRLRVDRRLALRVLDLVEVTLADPTAGIGKPERLRYLDSDTWSRRINQEHRLVYHVGQDRITFLAARYHYER